MAARPLACRSRRKRLPALVAVTSGPVVMATMMTFFWRPVAMRIVIMLLLLNIVSVIRIIVVGVIVIRMVIVVVAFILIAVVMLYVFNVVNFIIDSRHGCLLLTNVRDGKNGLQVVHKVLC